MKIGLKIITWLLLLSVAMCKFYVGKSKLAKYEIRRPLRYFYKKLQLKINVNPLIFHLSDTLTKCSSKLGPYCQFINKRNVQQANLRNIPQQYQRQIIVLKSVLQSTKHLAQQFQVGQLNGYLIANQYTKNLDRYIANILDGEMSQQQTSKYIQQIEDRTVAKHQQQI